MESFSVREYMLRLPFNSYRQQPLKLFCSIYENENQTRKFGSSGFTDFPKDRSIV